MLNQVNSTLIIYKFNLLPFDVFLSVLFLFHSEHVLIELLLKFFIGIVNAKLLKAIFFKDFKSKDVKETDKFKTLCLLGIELETD